MTLDFFNQFMTSQMLGIPLVLLAMIAPSMFIFTKSTRLTYNRTMSLQYWLMLSFTKQLMMSTNYKGQKWSSILLSLMLYLLLLNLLGLLPYTFTPTTQLSMNMGFAIPLWLATIMLGIRSQPTMTLGHLLPEGTPTFLIPILIIIETISLIIRPLALGVRLTANLTAGHLLIQLTSTATLMVVNTMPTTALLSFMVLILLMGLELAVAMIQAYVFTLLLSLYLQENV
uniref:ATP synthase subunit a n=2 Tax=Heloderma suspectum TaxID=8554 RepID=A1IGK0_HELSU|nr:ATP synthase F0 subunit 6 [Heloderma suspectum]AIL81916.1 ATP synthase F0 subunit 6 [Heloderma suspectum]BAF44010.1 ATPase subunit 6 [Heloderma suspectum]